jgi:hypothetical protein
MIVHLPAPTAVLEKNDDLYPNGNAEDDKIIIEFDTRERDHHKIFKLKRVVKIRWINERAVEAQELSGFAWPIIYRITTDDGYYLNEQSQRVYFTLEVTGLSMQRRVTDVFLRLGIFLCIIAGLGARRAS